MANRNLETFRTSHENFNRRDFDAILKTMSDNCSYMDHPRNQTLKGKNKFREFLDAWAKGFSDGRIVNPQYIDAGDTVIAQFTFEGTNDGSFMGMPATGRRISVPACEIARYDTSGRVISGGAYYDQYTIATQLGLIKPLATAA